MERFTTLSSSLVTVEAMGEGLEISIARTYVALSEVKKTLYSGHFEGLSPESRSIHIGEGAVRNDVNNRAVCGEFQAAIVSTE